MIMDGWWSPHVFSEPLCKCSAWFPRIFFITVHPATPQSVDHSTLLQDVIFVFGVHQEVLDGMASFEIHFNPIFSADVFAALTHALDIWDYYVRLVVAGLSYLCFNYPLIFTGLLVLFNVGSGSGSHYCTHYCTHYWLLLYLDNICVFPASIDEMTDYIDLVFKWLEEFNLKIKPKKYHFFQSSIVFPGHVLSAEGIYTNPEKVEKLKNWLVPTNPK